MAALTSGSWTITYRNGNRYNSTNIVGRKRYVSLILSLSTGEIAAGGIVLPGAGSVGMVRYLEGYTFDHDVCVPIFSTAVGRALKWSYNPTANKLIPYTFSMASAAALPSGARVMHITATTRSLTGAKNFYCVARGW